ncbi:hypothetical protein A3C91_01035 [Candidatus Azambacteria bacterium RIFCSPHIGHO2_02_FULL_52_12]|uniref:Histidine kinase N-terminal 7TM region domain-containing protein n=1 Tax=Candidatus Azambacteria bacterium RIFCSPLOWO2_01_FULL_46_25 TaxID=1797298 RepID=A0A1F5BU29_9BACT|nr:MAG: hypothetical protein A3C91_01035 [Candidatus Azambacteria bacterium RIFCSPHIGHO2_02_FULL_52_12]OGD34104.1 MAG: hypothetical protein A2988_01315 [Candidatus Azambacteria bacterium RIFCSPLOWO2_01_FULL_46_25]OGD36703.1 MAG: hypothetical protein A2850_00270 [Candidatus Azambacteria bacterium RIFCSPHIGHO2_01_FULL_51_74]
MFSIFVYLFSAAVSLWASSYFFRIGKKNNYDLYTAFGTFFFFLGLGFMAPSLVFFKNPTLFALGGELINFFVLLSFSFVLRALVRFWKVVAISVNSVTILGILAACVSLIVSLRYPPIPAFTDGLIYWHYALPSSIVYLGLLTCYTAAMGMTFFYNLKNIKERKIQVVYLGLAFLIGGASGLPLVAFNVFWALVLGFTLLFITFVLVTLFLLNARPI